MPLVEKFLILFLLSYVLAIIGDSVGQVTVYRKPVREVMANFKATLLRTFLIVSMFMVAVVVYSLMGYQMNQ